MSEAANVVKTHDTALRLLRLDHLDSSDLDSEDKRGKSQPQMKERGGDSILIYGPNTTGVLGNAHSYDINGSLCRCSCWWLMTNGLIGSFVECNLDTHAILHVCATSQIIRKDRCSAVTKSYRGVGGRRDFEPLADKD